MGGIVKAGARLLVNLKAGNCTGRGTQTHTLPTIHTQFVTRAPSETEAILPSGTLLLNHLPLVTLLVKSYIIFVTPQTTRRCHNPPNHSNHHLIELLNRPSHTIHMTFKFLPKRIK